MRACISAVADQNEIVRGIGNRVVHVIVVVYPTVLNRGLTTRRLRGGDGINFRILCAETDLLRLVLRIDGARGELLTHVNRGVLRDSLRAVAHMCRHREMERGVLSESDNQRVVGNRLGLVVQLPRIGPRGVRGGIRLQFDRGPVTNRVRGEQHVIIISMVIYINIVKGHLRVVHRDGDLPALHRRGAGNVVQLLHGIDLHGVSGGGRRSGFKGSLRAGVFHHRLPDLPRVIVGVAVHRRGVGSEPHTRILADGTAVGLVFGDVEHTDAVQRQFGVVHENRLLCMRNTARGRLRDSEIDVLRIRLASRGSP